MKFKKFYETENTEDSTITEMFEDSNEVKYIKDWMRRKRRGKTERDEDKTIVDKVLNLDSKVKMIDLLGYVLKHKPIVTMPQISKMVKEKHPVVSDMLDNFIRLYAKSTGDKDIHKKIAQYVDDYSEGDSNPRWGAGNIVQHLYKKDKNVEDEFEEDPIDTDLGVYQYESDDSDDEFVLEY